MPPLAPARTGFVDRALDRVGDFASEPGEFVAHLMGNFIVKIRNGPLNFAQRFADRAGDIMGDGAGELAAPRHDAPRGAEDLADEFRDLFAHVFGEIFEGRGKAMPETEFAGTSSPVVVAGMFIVGEQDDVGVSRLQTDIEPARAERAFDLVAPRAREAALRDTIEAHSSIARDRSELCRGIRLDLDTDSVHG